MNAPTNNLTMSEHMEDYIQQQQDLAHRIEALLEVAVFVAHEEDLEEGRFALVQACKDMANDLNSNLDSVSLAQVVA